MLIERLDDLLNSKAKKMMKLAVVASHDKEVLQAAVESNKLGIAEAILIGDEKRIREIAQEEDLDISSFTIIEERDLGRASEIGVKMVSRGEADFIMKGLVDTGTLLKAVLNKEWGLRTDSLLSHVKLYEIPSYGKLFYLTDGGMNLEPDLDSKFKIIENAGLVARALGKKEIKVAVLAAKEKLDPKMISTVDGSKLKALYKEGKFSSGIIVDGPMALDLAVSKLSASIKGYNSQVAGDADILLVPNIEAGNAIGKSIIYFAGGKGAGIIMGGKAPIVLTSRADKHETKLYSIGLASKIAEYLLENRES